MCRHPCMYSSFFIIIIIIIIILMFDLRFSVILMKITRSLIFQNALTWTMMNSNLLHQMKMKMKSILVTIDLDTGGKGW